MINKFIFLLVSILFYSPVFSQDYVKVNASPAIQNMMQKFIENGKANKTVKAWRIQIITTNDRREMEEAKFLFNSLYPNISVDWKHVAPYYQVRVGSYSKKLVLMPFLLELKQKFPAATPVFDNVNKRNLISN